MDPKIYSVIHVASAFLLTAMTFRACAAPTSETRKTTLMSTGILSLLMLVGGFGLVSKLGYAWEPWIIAKIGCWLGLSALAGFAYRAPKLTGLLYWVAVALVVTALVMVYVVNPRAGAMG